MKTLIHQMIKGMKYVIAISFIIFQTNTLFGQNRENLNFQNKIDSLILSKSDGFYQLTLSDIFLSSDGYIYYHKLSKEMYKKGKNETQIGSLRKYQLSDECIVKIFSILNDSSFAFIKNYYKNDKSDQTTISLKLYSNGKLVRSIVDYGREGPQKLQSFYSKMDSTVNTIQDWSQWNINQNIPLIGNIKVDSVRIIEHLKTDNGYYRNGIKESVTLVGEDKETFISKLNKSKSYVPYNSEHYSILTGMTERYSIVLFSNGDRQYMNYNGHRLVKYSFLHYLTKKNIVRRALRKVKEKG